MGNKLSFLTGFWDFVLRLFGHGKETRDPEQTVESAAHPDTPTEAFGGVPERRTDPDDQNENTLGPRCPAVNVPSNEHCQLDVPRSPEGLEASRVRADSSSSSSVEETDEQALDAKAQLLSIPDHDTSTPENLGDRKPNKNPERPIQLPKLIQCLPPNCLFENLFIRDILILRTVNRHLMNVVDEYFIHTVLPKAEIVFLVKHITNQNDPAEKEFQSLFPVIKRIDPDKRVLPGGRVVFEPETTGKQYTYRHGQFEPVELRFHLPDFERKYDWPLVAGTDPSVTQPISYREGGYSSSRNLKLSLKVTRMHHYIRLDTFDRTPIHVFYKDIADTRPQAVSLHAISIPVDFLRRSLCKEIRSSKRR